ncbi:helix-turn-helix domain-containing protein [Virgibacillus pantothenticus]|uniref:helix-turn-helix domain-containing protein n=1 Tax=Virgibacillus pantothenticus TaxID=1473 RepID=UPI0025AFF846|nr:helix-turn-helix transcriptional regulator [Virgibacillus pantothenticus]
MIKCILKNEIETRVLIAENKTSLKEFASDIDISQTYLTQILNGYRHPSPTVAYKIARGLRRDIEDIFLIKNVAKDNPLNETEGVN